MKSQNTNPTPPSFLLTIFRLFCKKEIHSDIEGDLIELYQNKEQEKGKSIANMFLFKHILLLFRPGIIKNPIKTRMLNFDIFSHYILIAFRNFRRFKTAFFINLVGLSSAILSVLLILLWVADEMAMDNFHSNDQRLFQLLENVEQDGSLITRITTAGPTSAALAEEFPEVSKAISMSWITDYMLSTGNQNISAQGVYFSPDIFNIFSFNLLKGNPSTVLEEKNSIVISNSLAESLFGENIDPIGQSITWQQNKEYLVSGIFEDVPTNSSIQFDFVLPFELFMERHNWVKEWSNTGVRTFLLLREDAKVSDFNDKITNLIKEKTNGDILHRTPFATSFSNRYLYDQYENGVQSGGRITYVKIFSGIATFILLIACFNFINLFTARVSRKMKEIGIRKTIGANRSSLMYQYFSEAMLISLISTIAALIGVFMVLPYFNEITGKDLIIEWNLEQILFLLGFIFLTGVIAGAYPSIFLSRFDPVKVLKANLYSVTGESWTRRGLVIFQFSLSIILIVFVTVIYQQIAYTQSKHLGYDKENVLVLRKKGALRQIKKDKIFIQEARNIEGIAGISSLGHDMTGHHGGTHGVVWPGKDPNNRTEFERIAAEPGVLEILNIEIKEGRSFSDEFVTDTASIIFNEAAIAFMNIEDPIGKKIELWGKEKTIVGVVRDFHYESFHEKVKPLFFWKDPNWAYNYMIKIKPGKEIETIQSLEKLNEQINPGFAAVYKFMDDDYQNLYQSEYRMSVLTNYFATIAIVISCLGLVGLAAFSVDRRIKEIGIRKILGSSRFGIIKLVTKDLTFLVVLALFIGLPVSYIISGMWLDEFVFRIDLSWWYFAGSGILALTIAWLTVSSQAVIATKLNPTECLKDE